MHRIAPLGQTKSSILTKQLLKKINSEIYLPKKIDLFDKMDEVQLSISKAENDLDMNIISSQIGQLNKKLIELNQKINNINLKKP